MAKKARYTFAKKTFYNNIMKNVVRVRSITKNIVTLHGNYVIFE